jgi:hypothetical protein
MKAKTFWTVVLTLGFLALVSCNQGPIFHTISTETMPLPPLISGSPTNMVLFNRVVHPNPDDLAETKEVPVLCVASGSLYWYGKTDYGEGESSVWKSGEYSIPQPGGKIIAIAASGDYLYALCLTGHNVNTDLKRIKKDSNEWKPVALEGGYSLIQSIHADPDPGSPGRLFAGARQNSGTREVYAVLYLDSPDTETPVLKILKPETSILSGAVYRGGSHYLITNGGGVFRVTETDLAADKVVTLSDGSESAPNNNRYFMGVIKLKDADETIIAVERGHSTQPERERGAFYKMNDDTFERMMNTGGEAIATGRYATGALALWEDPLDDTKKLLIAGIQGGLFNTTTTSYTYGYVEFDLDQSTGALIDDSPRHDQGRLISVLDNDRYTATIGKHSLNHLFQTPKNVDPQMTFFASTQIAGLWSYRNREKDGGWQWNAEN